MEVKWLADNQLVMEEINHLWMMSVMREVSMILTLVLDRIIYYSIMRMMMADVVVFALHRCLFDYPLEIVYL